MRLEQISRLTIFESPDDAGKVLGIGRKPDGRLSLDIEHGGWTYTLALETVDGVHFHGPCRCDGCSDGHVFARLFGTVDQGVLVGNWKEPDEAPEGRGYIFVAVLEKTR